MAAQSPHCGIVLVVVVGRQGGGKEARAEKKKTKEHIGELGKVQRDEAASQREKEHDR